LSENEGEDRNIVNIIIIIIINGGGVERWRRLGRVAIGWLSRGGKRGKIGAKWEERAG